MAVYKFKKPKITFDTPPLFWYLPRLPKSRKAGRFLKGGEISMINIKLKKGEQVERALKRLKKIMDKEGLIKQLRNGRYFEKPCEKKRKKSSRARIRSFMRRSSAM